MIDRAGLISQDSRGKELLQYIDALPQDGMMSEEGIEKFLDLLRIYERLYLEQFIKEHPDFPAKAAMAFIDQYDIEKLPAVMDIEGLTIPTNLKEFQLMEFQTAMILKGSGCSERLIADFLGRNRETVRKYLSPVIKVIEESLDLDKEETDALVKPVIKDIVEQLIRNTGAA